MDNVAKEICFNHMSTLFYYDETSKTGLRNKVKRGRGGSTLQAHDEAGSLFTNKHGYQCWVVKVSGKNYQVHRIVYLLMSGNITPELYIDHIDGNALNNKLENLRLVSQATNLRNQKLRITNSTGVTGVCHDNTKDGYIAYYFDENGKQRSKSFSCNKYGREQAFTLACEYRLTAIEDVNRKLDFEAGYSKRHGAGNMSVVV